MPRARFTKWSGRHLTSLGLARELGGEACGFRKCDPLRAGDSSAADMESWNRGSESPGDESVCHIGAPRQHFWVGQEEKLESWGYPPVKAS